MTSLVEMVESGSLAVGGFLVIVVNDSSDILDFLLKRGAATESVP